MSSSCARRQVSTSPLQPLFLLNSETAASWAAALAKSVAQQARDDLSKQINLAFQVVLARAPHDEEHQASVRYLQNSLAEYEEQKLAVPRIVGLDVPAASQIPLPEGVVRPSIIASSPSAEGHYVLHLNGYADHRPEPDQVTVTYYFNEPTTIAELELVVHQNGISRVEGFTGDAVDSLESIGEASHSATGRNQPFANERGLHVFQFDGKRIGPGRVFRFIVRETSKPDGYANYQAYPRNLHHQRIPPTAELVPDAPQPLAPLAKFCQTLMNLNEFLYVP